MCSILGQNQTAKGWNDNTIAKVAKASSVKRSEFNVVFMVIFGQLRKS